VGLLLALLSPLGAGVASAQDGAPAASAVPAVTIALTPDQQVIPLDGRSRYWVDPDGAATPDRVEAAGDTLPWATRRPGASYNLDGKALWVQFDVAKPRGQRWYVEVRSSGIDRVQMLYRNPGGHWVVQEAGDTKPVSGWPIPGRFPTFELAAVTDQPATVRHWLRIEHARVDFASPIALSSLSALMASREREQFLLGGYFGLALLVAVVSAAKAVGYRDRNFGVYAVYVTALAAGQLAYLGVGAQHLWVDWLKWNELSTFVLPGVSAAAALWFARTVTEPARFSRALDRVVWALIAALLGAVVIDTFVSTRATFALLLLIMAALILVAGLIALVWTQGDDPQIRLIALGFLPVMVAAVFPVLRGLNLIPTSAATRYALSFGAALEMPILFYALSLRGSVRRESQVRAAALSGQDALTGLAHARTLAPRLDNALKRARSLKHPCALLAARLTNHEAVAAEFGREVAERMLVVTAALLRNAITDIDLAVRIGERDFALLLEGPTTTENAIGRAQQLVASGLRDHAALPGGTVVKFNIAVALLPEDSLDAQASIKWLFDSLNAIRADTRKPIRAVNF
jgi:diguanylate cyclase (GGDEF)-like protein